MPKGPKSSLTPRNHLPKTAPDATAAIVDYLESSFFNGEPPSFFPRLAVFFRSDLFFPKSDLFQARRHRLPIPALRIHRARPPPHRAARLSLMPRGAVCPHPLSFSQKAGFALSRKGKKERRTRTSRPYPPHFYLKTTTMKTILAFAFFVIVIGCNPDSAWPFRAQTAGLW